MESKYELRETFLREFIKRTIESYIVKNNIKPIRVVYKPTIIKKIIPLKKQIPLAPQPVRLKTPYPGQMKRMSYFKSPARVNNFAPRPTMNPFSQPKMLSSPPQQQAPSKTPNLIGLGLGKLSFLLVDPSVSVVECTGPGKPIIAVRGGIVQSTAIVLSREDIEEIIKQISEKTRIPVLAGIFKAMIDPFIFTATISNFVGSRFLIQRKAQIMSQ